MTDKESDVFKIKRVTKQDDPLSSSLFNTVLQSALEGDLKKWQERIKCIRLGDKNGRFVSQISVPQMTCCCFPHR